MLRLAHNSHTVNAIAIAKATSAPLLHRSIAIDSVARRGRSRLFNLMAAGCHSSLTNIDIFCYVIRRPKVCNRKPLQKNQKKRKNKKNNVQEKKRASQNWLRQRNAINCRIKIDVLFPGAQRVLIFLFSCSSASLSCCSFCCCYCCCLIQNVHRKRKFLRLAEKPPDAQQAKDQRNH